MCACVCECVSVSRRGFPFCQGGRRTCSFSVGVFRVSQGFFSFLLCQSLFGYVRPRIRLRSFVFVFFFGCVSRHTQVALAADHGQQRHLARSTRSSSLISIFGRRLTLHLFSSTLSLSLSLFLSLCLYLWISIATLAPCFNVHQRHIYITW